MCALPLRETRSDSERPIPDPLTIYTKVVKVCTIEFIKQKIVFSTLIDTKKSLSLDSIVAGAEKITAKA